MSVRVIIGDVREKLRELPDESVHCVVTSPPYFGLRDYGTASWDGGDPACDHSSVRRGHGDEKQATSAGTSRDRIVAQDCKCGATRTDKQIGLEPSPPEFVQVMVEVFREVRRVLRDDGTLWLNLGDSYNNFRVSKGPGQAVHGRDKLNGKPAPNSGPRGWDGLKEKDLIGIPWRVAFALQADGWYLRQDIIWSKPNPMPESVTDRCTKAHEYLFLLSKSAHYHYDAEAIKECASENTHARGSGIGVKNASAPDGCLHNADYASKINGLVDERNRRSVWTVATQPFKEAHFATFPPDLIEPCIKAGCPKDCCAKCGAPVVRETERVDTGRKQKMADGWDTGEGSHGTVHRDGREKGERDVPVLSSVTTGWSPSCSCDAGLARGVVLDPFGGAGTTGLVADRLQRNAILIELNPEYMTIAKERIIDDAPLFAVLT